MSYSSPIISYYNDPDETFYLHNDREYMRLLMAVDLSETRKEKRQACRDLTEALKIVESLKAQLSVQTLRNVREKKVNDTLYQFQCDLPGFELNEITLTVEKGEDLVVEAVKTPVEKKGNETDTFMEERKPFRHVFKMPKFAQKAISASLDLGVLVVNVPLEEEKVVIQIQSGRM